MVIVVFGLAFSAFLGMFMLGLFESAFFFLGGIGVRQRSRIATSAVFFVYFVSTFLVGLGVVRVIFMGLLLSTVRGTWLSSRWQAEAGDPAPPPLHETLTDKFSDVLPRRIWPWGRWIFYVFASLEILLLLFALIGALAGFDEAVKVPPPIG